ncbi:LLM class flavin-dependent oxidoreductase [Halobacillus sp. A5]|uniref:LLM class flavin-dependent oxidoreductase n=1 Tax=Halobacillus sp. A5 TaxID=2880263 RepID=UPI0020A661E2|nr:LLM class flavin-dependent oxidoreductase [Halobacillus sp. A5]MCP3025941.1 LLM class flavin-dependent oxidoreductase [Halobacillus sp. A5]
MKLSVLDQSPISKGRTAEEALNYTLELAKYTEKLDYYRYWVAEHHNTNGLASSSPEVLISRIASVTSSIRVGSGGVLLPQYSPLKVAENFKLLEALFPRRIDLGLGRSPGGGKKTRAALNDGYEKPLSSFSRQVKELQQFLQSSIPKDHSYYGVSAKPAADGNPELWVLALTERGARHAALNGTGFTFGHFINPDYATASIRTYRNKFKPSELRKEPSVNACVFVVCAETKEKAEKLALSQDMWLLQVEKGLDTRVPSPDELKDAEMSEEELERIKHNRRRCIIGDPEFVYKELKKLKKLSDLYGTEEIIIITNIYDFEEKKNSYKLIAEYFKQND